MKRIQNLRIVQNNQQAEYQAHKKQKHRQDSGYLALTGVGAFYDRGGCRLIDKKVLIRYEWFLLCIRRLIAKFGKDLFQGIFLSTVLLLIFGEIW